MGKKLNIYKKNGILISFFVFVIYIFLSYLVFHHRFNHIFTHYSLPDVDTDGGIWYQWYLHFIHANNLVYDVNIMEAYPFGYDIAFGPISNLVYSTQVFILNIWGYSWSRLIFINNLFALLVYPFSALGAYFLCLFFTKSKFESFVGGIIYGFCFYIVFMGRGTMSINHIEFIPFYFLSLFLYLDKKTSTRLVISALVFSILFKVDSYYAFWSGLFSIIFVVFYKKNTFIEKAKTASIYYLVLFTVLFVTNMDFLIAQIPILFNKDALIQTGRNSNPRNELTSILYYFTLPIPNINRLTRYIGSLSIFMNLPFYIMILGLFFLRKSRLYILFFVSYLLAILLSSYIPMFYWINVLYFKFFGMFRSVGRLAMFAFLFSGLLVSLSLVSFRKFFIKKYDKKLLYGIYIILMFIILVANLNIDSTWYKLTNMSRISDLYTPLKDNSTVHSIVTYPLELSDGKVGFPQPYQIMGQVIYEKPLAVGVSQFGSEAQVKYQENISDITKKDTIDYLIKYGIDTIVIYNNLLDKSESINDNLKKDFRLEYIGNFSVPEDGEYRSDNDLSRDISVFQVKKVLEKNKNTPVQSFSFKDTTENIKVKYERIKPSIYKVNVMGLNKDNTLVFNFPYTSKWKLYEDRNLIFGNLSFIFSKPINEGNHSIYDEYNNGWTLNVDDLKSQSILDEHGNATFVLFFQPYLMYTLTNYITIISYTILIFFIIIKKVNINKLRRDI